MKRIDREPAYTSPGVKSVDFTARLNVCQSVSLLGEAIEIGVLDESGELTDLE